MLIFELKELLASKSIEPGLLKEIQDYLDKELLESLDLMGTSTDRLNRIVRQLLNISRASTRELNYSHLCVRKMLENLVSGLSHQSEEKNVEIRLKELPDIYSDEFSIEETFANLIGNAIQYSGENGGLIEIWGSQNEDESITYYDRDNGRGIAKEEFDKVFAPFRRVGKNDSEGEGIGLSYVQVLIRKLGGTIRFDSELGTAFSFKSRDSF